MEDEENLSHTLDWKSSRRTLVPLKSPVICRFVGGCRGGDLLLMGGPDSALLEDDRK